MQTLPSKYFDEANEILQVCKLLHQKNMLAAADGNVSRRLSSGEILITPSGRSKAFIEPKDFALVTIDNKILFGNPSGERLMHLEVYKKCENAKSVVHAHPPTAIAMSIAYPEWNEIPSHCLSELILALGSLPIISYARPGTIDMGTKLHPFLPKHRALILARHGAITWGESLAESYAGMERIEHTCEILYKALTMKGLTELPQDEVEVLKAMRAQMGEKIL